MEKLKMLPAENYQALWNSAARYRLAEEALKEGRNDNAKPSVSPGERDALFCMLADETLISDVA